MDTCNAGELFIHEQNNYTTDFVRDPKAFSFTPNNYQLCNAVLYGTKNQNSVFAKMPRHKNV